MWGNWLEKGKELATKAQAVAINLDKQLNENLGIGDDHHTRNSEGGGGTGGGGTSGVGGLMTANNTKMGDGVTTTDGWTSNNPTTPPTMTAMLDEEDVLNTDNWGDDDIDIDVVNGSSDTDRGQGDSSKLSTISASHPPSLFEDLMTAPESLSGAVAPTVSELPLPPPPPRQAPAVAAAQPTPTENMPLENVQVSTSGTVSTESTAVDEDQPLNRTNDQDITLINVNNTCSEVPVVEDTHSNQPTTTIESSSPQPPGWAVEEDGLYDGNDPTSHSTNHIDHYRDENNNNILLELDMVDGVESNVYNTSAVTEGNTVINLSNPDMNPEFRETETAILPDAVAISTTEEVAIVCDPSGSTSHHTLPPVEMTKDSMPMTPIQNSQDSSQDDFWQQQIQQLQYQLQQREKQLFSKTEQLAEIQALHEAEKQELVLRIQNTKEEAKRRIQKAKERVETLEAQFKATERSSASSREEYAKQQEIIDALRHEGEKLAHKQAEMEKAVRTARGEARELREKLENELLEKESALKKIQKLESELSTTKDDLASARRGESQADKLESEIRHAREETELKSATILSLEQAIKELQSQKKELQEELEISRKSAASESEKEMKKLRKEHNDLVTDLQNKLRTTEREAGIREDALRHEVAELRKRWQDAVTRVDSLTMDLQSSTAPLLRQLESVERQNRARASAWAELENSLRTQLEETVIANESLSKEKSEWKTKFTRLERASNEKETELKQLRSNLEEKSFLVKQLEDKVATMEREGAKMKAEWAEIERLANEGVTRVRSEMTQTVVEMEERYRAQVESLKSELSESKEKCRQLEKQVEYLHENAVGTSSSEVRYQVAPGRSKSTPLKLRQSEDPVTILAGALADFGTEDDADDIEDQASLQVTEAGSYAALSEYMSRLKAAEAERNALRQSLAESESFREKMVQEVTAAQNAREKLPLYEQRIQELSEELRQKDNEIRFLEDERGDARETYQKQILMLAAARPTSAETG